MLSRRTLIAAGAAAALPARASADARAAAEQLVAAMGGREAWSRVRGLTIAARHYETDVPRPYRNLILMDLDRLRLRLSGWNEDMRRLRVVDGDRGLRRREGAPDAPMTAAQVQADARWWEAHVYRNVRRLALGDPALEPRMASDGRLELYRPDGVRLMWYRLNLAGEPVAYGQFADDRGSILGPLETRRGGVRLPVWSTSADGTFRVTILEAAGHRRPPAGPYDRL